MNDPGRIVVLGAGPTGLSAAYRPVRTCPGSPRLTSRPHGTGEPRALRRRDPGPRAAARLADRPRGGGGAHRGPGPAAGGSDRTAAVAAARHPRQDVHSGYARWAGSYEVAKNPLIHV